MSITERVLGKKEIDVPITDTLETVFESGNVSECAHFVLWVENTGNKAISVANVEVSPDGDSWYSFDTVTMKLPSAGKAHLVFSDFPFARMQANCASGESTTIDIGITVVGEN